MIGEEVGKSLGIEFQVVAQELGLELAPVLGMRHPAAFEPHGVVLADKDLARELQLAAIGRHQAARAEGGARVKDRVDDAADRFALIRHWPHLFHAASR